jgi:DNA (cytosine-5)-methyltransferase 1
MNKPRLLDLFCKAGGAAMGYHQAGFEVVGVDIERQTRYPFEFVQGDALEYVVAHGHQFDAIHASPPCQGYSHATPPERRHLHQKLIPMVRDLLRASGKPYVIENVPGARHELISPLMLCGSMFGLPLERHRYFEYAPSFIRIRFEDRLYCRHIPQPVVITGTTRRKTGRFEYSVQACRDAAQIQWMTREELDEAIPPAYTKYIGQQLMTYITAVSLAV